MPAEPEAFLKDLDVDFLPGLLYIFVRSQGTNEKRCKIFNAARDICWLCLMILYNHNNVLST